MISGSQLQVAKLAQMCPAAPSTQQQPAVLSGGQQWPVATRVKTRVKTQVKTWVKTQVKTWVEQNPGRAKPG